MVIVVIQLLSVVGSDLCFKIKVRGNDPLTTINRSPDRGFFL